MVIRIKDLVQKPISGEWGNEDLSGSGVFVIRAANFTDTGKISYSNVVKREINSQKIQNKRLRYNDLIIEKSGGGPTTPVGRVVLFDKKDSNIYLFNNFTTILRPKDNLVNPRYLLYQLLHFYNIGKVKKYQNQTIGLYNLKIERYLLEEIELPDLVQQKKVVTYLDKV